MRIQFCMSVWRRHWTHCSASVYSRWNGNNHLCNILKQYIMIIIKQYLIVTRRIQACRCVSWNILVFSACFAHNAKHVIKMKHCFVRFLFHMLFKNHLPPQYFTWPCIWMNVYSLHKKKKKEIKTPFIAFQVVDFRDTVKEGATCNLSLYIYSTIVMFASRIEFSLMWYCKCVHVLNYWNIEVY